MILLNLAFFVALLFFCRIDDGVLAVCCTSTLGAAALGEECVVIFGLLTLGSDANFYCTRQVIGSIHLSCIAKVKSALRTKSSTVKLGVVVEGGRVSKIVI